MHKRVQDFGHELEAISTETAAKVAELGRTTIWKALNPDPEKRGGLPFLPSITIGRTRRIRVASLREWLREQENRGGA